MRFTTTAPDRRTLVKAISEHTGMEPAYAGPPTFAYTVGGITVDRDGFAEVPDEVAADLRAFLITKGWMEPEPSAEPEQPAIQIGVPADDLTVPHLTNLIHLLNSKQYLLAKATGATCIRIEDAVVNRLRKYSPESLESYAELLRNFNATGDIEGVELEEEQLRLTFPMPENGDSTLWILLVTRIVAAAKAAHRVYPRRRQPENEKYSMRGWLLRLGFGGPDFKVARHALLKNLNGCSAFPNDRQAQRHKARWAEIRRQHREARTVQPEVYEEVTGDVKTDT